MQHWCSEHWASNQSYTALNYIADTLIRKPLLMQTITLLGRKKQVKTGQVNPDCPLVGPSVDTFVGCFVRAFVGSPGKAEIGKSALVGDS